MLWIALFVIATAISGCLLVAVVLMQPRPDGPTK